MTSCSTCCACEAGAASIDGLFSSALRRGMEADQTTVAFFLLTSDHRIPDIDGARAERRG